jgi:hypothetical protein
MKARLEIPGRVNGCREGVPGVCMDPYAHYAQPRIWDKLVAARPLTDVAIARYQRQGRYGPGSDQGIQYGQRKPACTTTTGNTR